jgi:putative transcriptional regulator
MTDLSANALVGRLLIATPAMQDPNFARSVILVCEHNADGALGLVVNRRLPLQLGDILEKLEIPTELANLKATPLYAGGPVEGARGFVLHDTPDFDEDSLALGEALAVTASEAVLNAIAEGQGPQRFMLVLGYAGWGAGQLEQEFIDNAWLDVPASPDLIFDTEVEKRWRRAAEAIGIDLAHFSAQTGHA